MASHGAALAHNGLLVRPIAGAEDATTYDLAIHQLCYEVAEETYRRKLGIEPFVNYLNWYTPRNIRLEISRSSNLRVMNSPAFVCALDPHAESAEGAPAAIAGVLKITRLSSSIVEPAQLDVGEPYRRKRVASAMLWVAMRNLHILQTDTMQLHVLNKNTNAMATYEAWGFAVKQGAQTRFEYAFPNATDFHYTMTTPAERLRQHLSSTIAPFELPLA